MVQWQPLDSEQKLEALIKLSDTQPQLILKHSISCPTSAMVKSRLDRSGIIENTDYNILDLWNHRAISNLVAETFGVHHESPQVLVIHKGKCIYYESHYGITQEKIKASIAAI